MSGLKGTMANRGDASKGFAMGNRHVPMTKSVVGSIFWRLTGFHLAGKCAGKTGTGFGAANINDKIND
jgi:hypothetical protein